MIVRRSVSTACLAVVLPLLVGGCSGNTSADSSGNSAPTSGKPSATTISLAVNGQPVDLTGAAMKCYDYQGHLMLEAANAADAKASHFLMDYYRNQVSLSIGVRGGHPDLFDYEPGKAGQTATVTRDGDSVSAHGKIGVALDETTPPKPFSIKASCAQFFHTPPDSSKIGS